MSTEERVAQILEQLAAGQSVQLGEFGDNAVSTPADEEACLLFELAAEVRGR